MEQPLETDAEETMHVLSIEELSDKLDTLSLALSSAWLEPEEKDGRHMPTFPSSSETERLMHELEDMLLEIEKCVPSCSDEQRTELYVGFPRAATLDLLLSDHSV